MLCNQITRWSDSISDILERHGIKDYVLGILLWDSVTTTSEIFLGGACLYILVDIYEVGITTVIGSVAIIQLLAYRIATFLQSKEMAFDQVDLQQTIILTPTPHSVKAVVQVVGDFFLVVEESIKNIAITSDYLKILQGTSTLLFLSALGRLTSLPLLLFICWVSAFSFPFVYIRNQLVIDKVFEQVVSKSDGIIKKRKMKTKKSEQVL